MRRLAEHLGVSAPTLLLARQEPRRAHGPRRRGRTRRRGCHDERRSRLAGAGRRVHARPAGSTSPPTRGSPSSPEAATPHSVHQLSVHAVEVAATIGLSADRDRRSRPPHDLAGQRVHHHGEQHPGRHRLPPADRLLHLPGGAARPRSRPGGLRPDLALDTDPPALQTTLLIAGVEQLRQQG